MPPSISSPRRNDRVAAPRDRQRKTGRKRCFRPVFLWHRPRSDGPASFEQEPGALLGLIGPVVDQAVGGIVTRRTRDLLGGAQRLDESEIDGAKLGQLVGRADEIDIIVI